MKAYDLIVIGAGPGGYEAAFEAADLGMKTALVEKEALGGTCLNHGCIPTKSLLHAAGLYRSIREADLFGISAEHVALDFARMQARKNEVVLQLRKGIEMTAGKKKIDLFRGKGTLQGGRCVLVKSEDGEEMLEAQHILLAPGSRPALPPIPGIDLEGVVTSDELLEAEKLPQRLVIIGGGVIGVEFASVFAALGTSVTVIEAMGQLLPSLDREIAQSLKMLMKKRGVKVLTDTRVQEIRKQKRIAHTDYTRRDGRANSYLGGFLICANCGGKYSKSMHKKKDGVYNYYVCNSRSKHSRMLVKDASCKNKNWRMEELDNIIFNEIKKLAISSEFESQIGKYNSDNSAISKEIAKLDNQIDKLIDLYAIGNIPQDVLQKKIFDLARKKTTLESKKNDHDPESTIDLIHSFSDILELGDFREIRSVISSLIQHIELDGENVHIHWNF